MGKPKGNKKNKQQNHTEENQDNNQGDENAQEQNNGEEVPETEAVQNAVAENIEQVAEQPQADQVEEQVAEVAVVEEPQKETEEDVAQVEEEQVQQQANEEPSNHSAPKVEDQPQKQIEEDQKSDEVAPEPDHIQEPVQQPKIEPVPEIITTPEVITAPEIVKVQEVVQKPIIETASEIIQKETKTQNKDIQKKQNFPVILPSIKNELPTLAVQIGLLGNAFTGKSCLCRRLSSDQYSDLKPTIGVDTVRLNFSHNQFNYSLTIFDTAGMERFQSMAVQYVKKVDYCLLVYSCADQKSLDAIPMWVDFVKSNNASCKMILVGTKVDLLKSLDFSKIDKKQFVKEVRCSALTGENVGQTILVDYQVKSTIQSNELVQKEDKKGKGCC